MAYKPTPAPERFAKYVDRRGPDECWPWLAHRVKFGHGAFFLRGQTYIGAHRFAYMLHTGEQLGRWDFVCHKCDNPWCVNPAHLYRGTPADNSADMFRRGRARSQKLTHCRQGHEFTPENTIWLNRGQNGSRLCRICRRRAEAAYRQRRRAQR